MPKIPSKNEIRSKAVELWLKDIGYSLISAGEEVSTPTDNELKESGYWDRAKRELMTTSHTEVVNDVKRSLSELTSRIYYELDRFEPEIKKAYESLREMRVKPSELDEDTRRILELLGIVKSIEHGFPEAEVRKKISDLTRRLNEKKKQAEDYRRRYLEVSRRLSEAKKKLEEAEARLSELKIKTASAEPDRARGEIIRHKNDFWMFFQAELIEDGVKPTTAKRYKPVFEKEFKGIVEDVGKGVYRGLGVSPSKYVEDELSRIAETVITRKPPTVSVKKPAAAVKEAMPTPPSAVGWKEVIGVYGEPKGRNPNTGRVMDEVRWFYYPEYGNKYRVKYDRYSLWYDRREKRYYLYDEKIRKNIPVSDLGKVIDMGLAVLEKKMGFEEHVKDSVLRTYRLFKDIEYSAEFLKLPVDKVRSIVDKCLKDKKCREEWYL